MRLRSGRIPDYIFNDKSNMEKEAQYDDDFYDERGWDEGMDDIRDMGNQEGWEDGVDEMRQEQEEGLMEGEPVEPWLQEMRDKFSRGTSVFEYFKLVPEENGAYELWGYGYYGSSSVLAGQYFQAFLDDFDSLEEAREAYPHVDIKAEGNLPSKLFNSVPDVPPDDFDPADAGERWDEDY